MKIDAFWADDAVSLLNGNQSFVLSPV